VTDFLDEKRQEIAQRLKELKPAVDEFARLEAAASALKGVGGSSATATPAPRRRGPGRPRGSVHRQELAAKMGIKQNYLYRVLPGLEQEKKVSKQGRGWHPRKG